MNEQAVLDEALVLDAPTPQLLYSLDNPDAPGVIYVSSKAADNQLSLVMSSTVAASFSAGDLVPPGEAMSGTGSLLYLDLSPLGLSAAEFDAIELTLEGWTAQRFDGQQIGFTPDASVSLGAAPAALSFALAGFTMAQAPGNSASLTMLAYRVSGITSGSFPVAGNIAVVFQLPDTNTGDLADAIAVAMTPAQVVSSASAYPQIANRIALTLTQQPNMPIVASGDDTAFTLNFVYADDPNGYGALLTVAEGKDLEVSAAQGTTDWTITPHPNADPPFWTLTPPENQALFGGGSQSTIEFDITNVVTSFKPGPTVALIGYSNVPGYKNGSFSVTLLKQPHVTIDSFTVDPPQSVLEEGSATVTLAWSTTNATRLTLQPIGADVTNMTSFQATIGDTTQFTLVAEGQRPGNVDNVASQSALAQVLPVINGFTASPSSIYVGDFGTGYPTTLAWNVNTNDNVTLTSSVSGPVGAAYPPASQVQLPIAAPQMLTLAPQVHSGDPTVERSLIVSGFQLQVQQQTTNHDSAFAAAPSSHDFVAVTAPSENLVAILSTANYFPITAVAVGSKPLGIAFSADGSLMYVANSGDGSVSVVQVAAGQGSLPFSFTSLATVHVGGAPQSVVVGPDGTAYVTVSNGASTNGQVAIITNSGGNYAAGTPIEVGIAPAGLALSQSGASLYVANSGSGTITLVTLGGSSPAAGTLLSGIGTPQGIAVTPDGKKLLVAAGGDNMVYGYNTQFPATSPRQTYAVPGASGIAAFPTGDYALATGTGPNAVVLINYAKGTISTSQSLTHTPLGLALAPEGGIAFVATPAAKGVVVVTFGQYAQVASTTAAGGLITNVAVSPDNQSLVGWFDAAIAVMGPGQPLKGLLKGSVSGVTTTLYLAGKAINTIAISPVVAEDTLYVAASGAAQIDVYALSSMTSVASIPIVSANAPARQVVGLAVSSDGATLFALTNDGSNAYSFVTISADVAQKAFSVVSDTAAYTAQRGQVAFPFAAAPTASGFAAYAVDTTSATLWTLAGSASSWTRGSSGIALAPGVSPPPVPSSMAVSPDGSVAYVSMQAGTTVYIATVDLLAGTATVTRMPNGSSVTNITAIAVSADGRSLYASDAAAAAIRIFDAASLRIDQTMSWQSGVQAPWGMAATADGSSLFSANVNSSNIGIAQQVNPA